MAYHKTTIFQVNEIINIIVSKAIGHYVKQSKEQNQCDFEFICNWLRKIAKDFEEYKTYEGGFEINVVFGQELAYIFNDRNKCKMLIEHIEGLKYDDRELIQKMNAKYAEMKKRLDLQSLERIGICIVKSTMILTFEMSEAFISIIKNVD